MSPGASVYGSGLFMRVATTDEYVCVWYVWCSLTGPVGAGTGQQGRGQGGRGRGSAHRNRERSQSSEVAREFGGGFGSIDVMASNATRTTQSNEAAGTFPVRSEMASLTPMKTPPPLPQDIYVDKLVAFSPQKGMKSTT
ncbi:hypothetical protein JG688_00016266 [Phytophthora aleatoria]|uniref:Uncharacterized protein n=1 Tax=Phytophthora aleatoria TaxID=2496075 RepID=A0A8J5M270_9STRA|nr:hypothetical protein JG688_00016266 [Phytophthora aleatoria]